MIRSDWQLIPRKPVKLETLCVEIPFKIACAQYLCYFPGTWGSTQNAASIPSTPVDMPFKPFIWIGDNDRGFCWFSESDRNFFLSDANKALQLIPGASEMVLRVNLVTQPQTIDAPLEYTFGYQATPVRDNREDAWDYRINHGGDYGIEDLPYGRRASIEYPAQGQLSLGQGTIEAWVKVNFDPNVEVTDQGSRGRLNRDFLLLTFPRSSAELGLYWNIDDRGMRAYLRNSAGYPMIVGAKTDWKTGEWHHVAMTWNETLCIWVDGKKRTQTAWRGTPPRELGDAKITFYASPVHFDVDEVRISDVAREAFDLSQAPQPDDHTILLDHLDGSQATASTTTPERGAPGKVTLGKRLPGRFGQCLGASDATADTTVLDRLAELGVRTLCFHEHWTDIQNYTTTTHGDSLRRLVQACHARGIRLLLYFGYLMSDIAPEWQEYSDTCLVSPRTGDYARKPKQTAYSVCYRSVWQDFLADGIARVMDKYDIDGVYLDGTEYPWPCANTKHGCGYRRPDSSIAPTYPIFETRTLMKRIWNIVKTRKPDGLINVHNSTCLTIPTNAFATSTWDGEQLTGLTRDRWAMDVLPLDAFRCEFMGRQWGVPSELLCYGQPFSYTEAMAFSLLHDVPVRGNLGGSLEIESRLWKTMDAFGRHQARWIPYWRNQDVVATDNEQVKVSLYTRSAAGVLVVISNLGKQRCETVVRLDLKPLGLFSNLTAWDVVNEAELPMASPDEFPLTLDCLDFRVLWLRPKNASPTS
jgi:hypothetical protein